jgi:hypothetical protein
MGMAIKGIDFMLPKVKTLADYLREYQDSLDRAVKKYLENKGGGKGNDN